MRTRLVTPPADEPLTLEEVRQHLRNPEATGSAVEEELYRYIQAARELAENKTGRALLTQTWDIYWDGFSPRGMWLPYPPLQSVSYIKYLDDNLVLQTVSTDYYSVDVASAQARISLLPDYTWPSPAYRVSDSVVMRIVCGYVDPEYIPASIKSWMLLAIEAMDKGRSLTQERPETPMLFADRLLDRYVVLSF